MGRDLNGRKSMFAVDPMDPRGLTDQLADSVRQAIRRGELKPGDRLPGVRTLAADLKTSVFVPHEALKRLVGEGLVVTRRGNGAVVADGHNFEILKILGDSGKPYFFTSSQPITHLEEG